MNFFGLPRVNVSFPWFVFFSACSGRMCVSMRIFREWVFVLIFSLTLPSLVQWFLTDHRFSSLFSWTVCSAVISPHFQPVNVLFLDFLFRSLLIGKLIKYSSLLGIKNKRYLL